MANANDIITRVSEILSTPGFEVYPFLIGWYNDKVDERFRLPYSPDALAFSILSTPALVDEALHSFIIRRMCVQSDPIDERLMQCISLIREAFPAEQVDVLHDNEMIAPGHPRILVQTAGHVAGAAYYYQRSDVDPDPWDPEQNIYGKSIHPTYEENFFFRSVIIFGSVEQPDLPRKAPVDCIPTMDGRISLLTRVNHL